MKKQADAATAPLSRPMSGDETAVTDTPAGERGIVARLRVRGGREVSCESGFTTDQWAAMEQFIDAARALSRTPLLARPYTLAFEFSTSVARGPVLVGASLPDRDQVRALLGLLRPFLLEREPTSFVAMRKMLRRRLDHENFRQYLDRQRDIFKGRRITRTKVLSEERLPLTDEAIAKWMGGQAPVDAGEVPASWTTDAVRALLIALLLEKARAIIDVADAVFAIRTGAPVVPLPGDTPLDLLAEEH